jgi:general secretion pathway protein F
MPAFAYRAVDQKGAEQRGLIEAASARAARGLLRDRALLPLVVETAAMRKTRSFRLRRRIGARTLSTITRQLATLIGSEVNVEEALRLAAEEGDVRSRAMLLDVRGAVLDGRSLAQALASHPDAFPDYYRASVAAGEQSGRLAEVLRHLADFVEARHRNRQKVQLALLYPALLGLVSFGMIALLLVYVVPDIVRVFVSRGAELPFLTRALIAVSGALKSYGLAATIVLAAAAALGLRWAAVPVNRLRLDAWLSRTRLSRQHNAARFAASLATLVQSAVPLVEALEAAAAVTPNRYVRARAMAVAERIREGASLRAAMSEAAVFPPMLVAIVSTAEASGQLAPALARAAAELERELDALSSAIVALVEPAVLLLMGGIVLLLVLAILLPIIGLNNLAVI